MFYKFINENTITLAPMPLSIDGNDVFTNSETVHNANGYCKLVDAERPQDDKVYEVKYVLKDNAIHKMYVETDSI